LVRCRHQAANALQLDDGVHDADEYELVLAAQLELRIDGREYLPAAFDLRKIHSRQVPQTRLLDGSAIDRPARRYAHLRGVRSRIIQLAERGLSRRQ
jgi:hypothetical protein